MAISLVTLLWVIIVASLVTSISPIYDFAPAKPFQGPDIFNPYRDIDSTHRWLRANFHAHTRVKGPLNECEYWPDEVCRRYASYGYDVIGISNHNEITEYPEGVECRVPMYEHGYNIRNYHKLVIGAEDVMPFDALLPLFPSQMQWQVDLLSSRCDVLQLNHPTRTPLLSRKGLGTISGYDIVELSGTLSTIENVYWDRALSAGRYSFGLLNDDLHFPDISHRIATRCSFLSIDEATEEDVIDALRSGCFYSVRVPDYGDGNIDVKHKKNSDLPSVRSIGVTGDTIYIALTEPAHLIRAIGEEHSTLCRVENSDSLGFRMDEDEPYARFVVSYPDSLIIMSNPFARYDAEVQESPADVDMYDVNIPLTILYNLVLALVVIVVVWLYIKLVKRWRTS